VLSRHSYHGAGRTADSGSMTLLGKAAQSGSCRAQWSAEANALITMFFFAWLVGPLERKPVEVRRGGPDTMRVGTHCPAASGDAAPGVRSSVAAAQVTFEGEPATWNSGVQIKKCRYLEASGCVALCVNLCKARQQARSSIVKPIDGSAGCGHTALQVCARVASLRIRCASREGLHVQTWWVATRN